jgi:hypothetical protein
MRPNANKLPCKCASCHRDLAPGQGRFIGRGLVVCNQVGCLRVSRGGYQPRTPPARVRRIAQRFLAPALALLVVLSTAAAGSGDGDWALVIPGEQPICAKTERMCYAARDAIGAGHWRQDLSAQIYPQIDCVPAPGCFPAASNYIKGFNDR